MEMEEERTLYDVYHEMYETDRIFFNTMRFIDSQHRSAVMLNYLRNTNLALSILRSYEHTQARQPTQMVLNIPLNLSDISGGNTSTHFFDPVPVVPTQQQIRNAVDHHVGVTDTTCSICQEPVTCATRIRECGHCFHGQCIQQWLTVNPRCPMCRFDIRDTVDVSGNRVSILQDASGNRTG